MNLDLDNDKDWEQLTSSMSESFFSQSVSQSVKQPIISSSSDDEDYDPNEDPAYARALADKEAQWAEYAQAKDWAIANWPTNKIRIKAHFPDLAEYELVDILKEVRQEMASHVSSGGKQGF